MYVASMWARGTRPTKSFNVPVSPVPRRVRSDERTRRTARLARLALPPLPPPGPAGARFCAVPRQLQLADNASRHGTDFIGSIGGADEVHDDVEVEVLRVLLSSKHVAHLRHCRGLRGINTYLIGHNKCCMLSNLAATAVSSHDDETPAVALSQGRSMDGIPHFAENFLTWSSVVN